METTWRIYYDSGATFGPEDGAWEDAPLEGVLAVVERRGDKRTIHSGGDHYLRCADDGTIVATDDAATILRSLGYVKFGRYTSNVKMARLFERIRDEWKAG